MLTIHVGAGKCGSSAIQEALTARPVFKGEDGRRWTYAAIDGKGVLRSGTAIAEDPRRLVKSALFRQLSKREALPLDALRDGLHALDGPILSNEGQINDLQGGQWLLEALDMPVHVVAYVRPQVDYVNSAWWQWGAWSEMPRQDWIEQRIKRALWGDILRRWQAIPQVRQVTVRLLPREVVSDVFGLFGAEPSSGEAAPRRSNVTLSGTLLRLLQRHPALRATFGKEIDFELSKLLARFGHPGDRAPTPWVIGPDLAQRILSRTAASNRVLLSMLDPDSAARMSGDPRWWEAGAYADRAVEPFDPPAPADSELDALAAILLEAQLRGLRRKRPGRPSREPAQ